MTNTTPQELRALDDAALDTDADPTEAFLLGFRIGQSSPVAGMEIEAAAMSLFRDDTNWADPDPSDGRVKDWWDGQPEDIRARYRLKALHALRAARNNNDRSVSVRQSEGETMTNTTKTATALAGGREADEWLTRREAAEYAKTTPGTLATFAAAKRGPKMYKPSTRKVLYRKSDLDAWITSREAAE